jgi:hypothetical protein
MDRRERERILGEHGVHGPGSPVEERLVRNLETDLEGSPLRGRPLEGRLRNFRPGVDSYVAGLHGPPAHVRRLREIEGLVADHESRLAAAWAETAAEARGDQASFEREWRRRAARWSFHAVNDLIGRHNRYYPAEARLPMNPRTGDFVLVAGKPYRRTPLDAAWVLDRFPPLLALAAAAA